MPIGIRRPMRPWLLRSLRLGSGPGPMFERDPVTEPKPCSSSSEKCRSCSSSISMCVPRSSMASAPLVSRTFASPAAAPAAEPIPRPVPVLPPIAPALTNALYAANRVRLRRLPLVAALADLEQ